jgi:DNA-binding transcriptional LysR family regulator
MEAVDSTRLRYFFVVAEEGHVGRAAARLGITQPSLSQQIRRLESEIGTTLFLRHPKGVELTDAGARLDREARPAYAALSAAVRGVRVSGRNEVRIGICHAAFSRHPAVAGVAELAATALHGAEIEYVPALTSEAVGLVRAGHLDVAFIYDPLEDTEVDAVMAFTDAPVVVLPASHVLAEQDELTIDELAPYPILWWERDALPGTHDALVAACRRAGFEPDLIDVPDIPGVLGRMLAEGVGVSVISEFVARANTDPAIVWRPLSRPRVVLNGLMIWSRRSPSVPAEAIVAGLGHATARRTGEARLGRPQPGGPGPTGAPRAA